MKSEEIMQHVHEDTSEQSWFSTARMVELFVESMALTMDTFSDTMPSQGPFDMETRPKLIHSTGAVTSAKWVSRGNHNFTGIFTGADDVVLRLSLAKQPTTSPANCAPGVGVKVLRDTLPSCNFVAMYALGGQSSFNFFEHDFTNHVPALGTDADTSLVLLAKKFATVSKWPTMVGLSDCATFDAQGKKEANPRMPFRLVLHPSKEAHTAFSAEPRKGSNFHLEDLDGWKVDTLWTVYAQNEPSDKTLTPIADIQMKEAFDASHYSDETLFYRHQRMDEDLELRPDWVDPVNEIIDQ